MEITKDQIDVESMREWRSTNPMPSSQIGEKRLSSYWATYLRIIWFHLAFSSVIIERTAPLNRVWLLMKANGSCTLELNFLKRSLRLLQQYGKLS